MRNNIVAERRIHELFDDGYIFLRNGQWQLTELGWVCLSACADRPIEGRGSRSRNHDEVHD